MVGARFDIGRQAVPYFIVLVHKMYWKGHIESTLVFIVASL